MLTSPTGRILWYWDVSTAGWPSHAVLARYVASRARPRAQASGRRAAAQRSSPGRRRRWPPCTPGRPAARRRAGARRPDPRAARLPDRDQRLGVVVRAVPRGVRPVRLRVGTLRTPGRVPRRRHQRLRRRRPRVPGPAPRQLPQLPDHAPPDLLRRSPRSKACRRRSSSTAPARSSTCTPASTTPRGRSTRTSAATRKSAAEPLATSGPAGER